MIQCQNQSQVLRHVLKIKFLSSDYFLHHDTALASDTMTWALYSIICKFKYWSFLTSWHSHLYISVCAISVCSKSKLLYMYDSTQTYIYTIQFKHIYIYIWWLSLQYKQEYNTIFYHQIIVVISKKSCYKLEKPYLFVTFLSLYMLTHIYTTKLLSTQTMKGKTIQVLQTSLNSKY